MGDSLCGWIGGSVASGRAVIESMAAAHAGPATLRPTLLPGSGAAVGAIGGSAYQAGPLLSVICGHATFADARLADRAQREGAAAALADAYAAHGSGAIELLRGDFALALLDEQRGEAVLAVDRMGIGSITYALTADCLVFATRADAINRHPEIRPGLDPQGIYNYVYFHMVPSPGTIYRGQQRLLPGHLLRFARGKAETAPYWEMRFEERKRAPFEQLKREFLEALRGAVREASTGQGTVGTFMSGGTDSSTIAGLLGEVSGEPARTYSIGFKQEGYDEMEYARIAARHFGTRHHEYYVTPDDVVAAIPLVAAAHDQPFGNASAVPTYYCAKLAKDDGVQTLLGGDGGDELFGGNTRYAKQYLYSLYSDLPPALRNGLIEPVAFLLPEAGVIGKAQRYMRNAMQPMPARYDNYNLLERLGAANVFTPEFLATVDVQLPQAQMAQTYQRAHAGTLINRMLAFDFKYTLADNDLPKVTRSCELAGVDVRYPMLGDAVVAFSASLAPGLKLKGTRLRYFFKQALREFLPEQIITKSKHGFGLPFGHWLQAHPPLQQIAFDSLASLKARNVIRAAFIDELASVRVSSHADYYGTMVWILMMLEQWFRQHRPVV